MLGDSFALTGSVFQPVLVRLPIADLAISLYGPPFLSEYISNEYLLFGEASIAGRWTDMDLAVPPLALVLTLEPFRQFVSPVSSTDPILVRPSVLPLGCGAGAGFGEGDGDGAGVGVGVGVGVGLGGIVGVGEHGGTPWPWHQLISMESTRQPSPEPVLSLAIRHRRVPCIITAGRRTVVVMKPPELPLQA